MKSFFRGRFFGVLVLILCFLLGFMLSVAVKGYTMPHEQLMGVIVSPIQSAFSWCSGKVTDFFDTFSRYDALVEENESLRRKNLELQKSVDELHYSGVQLDRYKDLLNMNDGTYTFEYTPADVVSVSGDGWGHSFGINAGTRSGIEKGDVVVSQSGLVGKVTEVGLNWATVSTFLDPQISVGAMVISTGDVGVTEATPELKAQGVCKVLYLKKEAAVNRGDAVYTSGLGGVYPKGLLIGKISDLSYENNGLTLSAMVTPAVSFADLKEVFVITNFVEDPQ